MKKTKLLLAMLPFITAAQAAEETVIQEPDMLFYIVPNAQAKEAEDNSAVASDLALAVARYVPVLSPSSLTPSINTATRPPIKKRVKHHKTHSAVKKPSATPGLHSINTTTAVPASSAAVPTSLAPASSAAVPCVPATKGQDSIFLRVIK